jgi:hypothetical protein
VESEMASVAAYSPAIQAKLRDAGIRHEVIVVERDPKDP